MTLLIHLMFWLPFICTALHVFEEFAWPGGFSSWYASIKPETAVSFTPNYAIAINSTYITVALALAWLGPTWSRGVSLWLVLAAIGASNALFHIWGVIRLRRYSPGVVTGVFLFIPLCVWGVWHFLGTQEARLSLVVTSIGIGTFLNFWALIRHRWRAAAISQEV
jgi:hypothetical protein